MRAFTRLWDRICLERYGVTDPKLRRFRYGMQVNSLGLTEEQPENNVQRIVLEMLGVTLSKDARARAIQLPCWNEAIGLPTPVGPAVVAPHAAGARLRDRPARVRATSSRAPSSSRRKTAELVEAAGAELAVGPRRRWRVRDDRRDEGPARPEQRRAGPHASSRVSSRSSA